MRASRYKTAVLVVFLMLMLCRARARTVTIIIAGSVGSGTDESGVFGRAGSNLAGRPFTLIFRFDESKTSTQAADCRGTPPYSPVICTSQRPSQSPPGTATLQIGDSVLFEFGAPTGNATCSATRTTWLSPTFSYRITLGVGDGSTMVSGYIGSATPKPAVTGITLPPQSAAWDYPLSDNSVTTAPGITFTIDARRSGAKAYGLLLGTAISIGGCDRTNGLESAEPYTVFSANGAKALYPCQHHEYPVNLERGNCYGFAFGGATYWGSMNAADVQHVIEAEFTDVTGTPLRPRDRILYMYPSPDNPHALNFTHAQVVTSVPANITDPNDKSVIVDSRKGPDEILHFSGPGSDRYHGPASGDPYITKIFRVYRLKPCSCN